MLVGCSPLESTGRSPRLALAAAVDLLEVKTCRRCLQVLPLPDLVSLIAVVRMNESWERGERIRELGDEVQRDGYVYLYHVATLPPPP